MPELENHPADLLAPLAETLRAIAAALEGASDYLAPLSPKEALDVTGAEWWRQVGGSAVTCARAVQDLARLGVIPAQLAEDATEAVPPAEHEALEGSWWYPLW